MTRRRKWVVQSELHLSAAVQVPGLPESLSCMCLGTYIAIESAESLACEWS